MNHLKPQKEDKPYGVWLTMLRSFPAAAGWLFASKRSDLSASLHLRGNLLPIDWNSAAAAWVRSQIAEYLKNGQVSSLSRHEATLEAGPLEQQVMEEVISLTRIAGASNLTRTQAYLDIYRQHPELHWALLAHMVSRNAGWNMTDLAGGQNNELDTNRDIYRTYRLLERSNALIFQDAYPQLLLYRFSKQYGKSLFHLLPKFHVSPFMCFFWEQFWLKPCSALLSVGLIINEQNYIERRVVQNPFFRKAVMGKAAFKLSSFYGFNQVLFPYLVDGKEPGGSGSGNGGQLIRLAGRTLHSFGKLEARVEFGKQLYALLFGLQEVKWGAERFATAVVHTGSRSDYWPGLFTANSKEAQPSLSQGAELLDSGVRSGNTRIYSPYLADVFQDTPYEAVSREDWLKSLSPLAAVTKPRLPLFCEISSGHQTGVLKKAYAHDSSGGVRLLP